MVDEYILTAPVTQADEEAWLYERAVAYINEHLPMTPFELDLIHYAGFHYRDIAPMFGRFISSTLWMFRSFYTVINQASDTGVEVPDYGRFYVSFGEGVLDTLKSGKRSQSLFQMFFSWLLMHPDSESPHVEMLSIVAETFQHMGLFDDENAVIIGIEVSD